MRAEAGVAHRVSADQLRAALRNGGSMPRLRHVLSQVRAHHRGLYAAAAWASN